MRSVFPLHAADYSNRGRTYTEHKPKLGTDFTSVYGCHRSTGSEVSRRSDSLLPDGVFNHIRVLEQYARRTGWFYYKFLVLNLWFSGVYIFNRMLDKKGQYESPDP